MIRSNTTYVRLTFHTWSHGSIRLKSGRETSLIAYDFNKELGQPSGEVQFRLKAYIEGASFSVRGGQKPLQNGDPWLTVLEDGDWWSLQIERNNQVLNVSWGVVDSITADLSANRGETQITVIVSGRDLGWALEDMPVYFNPFDDAANNALGVQMQRIVQSQTGDAASVIRNMIRGMFGRLAGTPGLLGQIRVPPTANTVNQLHRAWIDKIDLATYMQQTQGRVIVPQVAIDAEEGSGSIWEFINQWRNPALNELFIDVNPLETNSLGGFLFLRERPFVNQAEKQASPWFKLPPFTVDARSLLSMNVTRGVGRVNHVLLVGDLTSTLGVETYGINQPAANLESIKTWGLNRLLENTSFFEDVGAVASENLIREWRSRLVSWHALAHLYYQGTLSIAEARPDIRIGSKVALVNGPPGNYQAFPEGRSARRIPAASSALTFYVEGVRYSGSFGEAPEHRTDVTVSRGILESRRVPTLLKEYAQWTTINLGSLGTGTSGYTPVDQRKLVQRSAALNVKGPPDANTFATEKK